MFHVIAELLFRRAVVLSIAAVAAVEGYLLLRPANDELGFLRRTLAERVCANVAGDLPRRDGLPSIAVLNLAGDPDLFVTNKLRASVRDSGKYNVVDESFLQRVLRELGRPDVPVSDLDGAIAVAKKLGTDFVLFGEVVTFETTERGAALKLNVRLAERASREAVFARAYERTTGGSRWASSYWRARIADRPKLHRILLWVVVALLLPIVTAPIIRKIAAEDSNALNLLMLVTYTTIDVLVAAALTGFWLPSYWTVLTLLCAGGLAGYYNYRVATTIDEVAR